MTIRNEIGVLTASQRQ